MRSSNITVSKIAKPSRVVRVGMIFLVIAIGSGKYLLAMAYRWILSNLSGTTFDFLLKLSLLIALYCVGIYFYTYLRQTVRQKLMHEIQVSVLKNRIQGDLSWWEEQSGGKWQTAISNDSVVLSGYYTTTLLPVLLGISEFVWAIVYGISASPLLTALIVILSFSALLIPKVLAGSIEKTQMVKQKNDELVRETILEGVKGLPIIKTFSCEDFITAEFKKRYTNYADSSIKHASAQSKMEAINIGVGFFANTIWMIIGILLIKIGKLQISEYIGFMVLCNCFNWPFFELSTILSNYSRQKVSLNRLFESMRQAEDQKYLQDKILTLTADDITFNYGESASKVIEKFRCTFDTSKTYAILGQNGAGKTTLIKILMGLYRPQKGNVYVNQNLPIGDMFMSSSMAYVPQKCTVFSGTVFENISCSRPGSSLEEVINAAKNAYAHDFISNLPDGYMTYVGSNSRINLSQGQMQRISLARAFLKDADVTFLDEPTSALDEENERNVLRSIHKNMKCIVLISHKPSVLSQCDEIVSLS